MQCYETVRHTPGILDQSAGGRKCSRAVLAFDERLQPRQRTVPVFGNTVKICPRLIDRTRVEFKPAFAAATNVAYDARALQHSQMLRDGLPRQARPRRQLRDRMWLSGRELCDQQQPCLVTQGGKHGRVSQGFCNNASTSFWRHGSRCSSSAPSSRPRSCAALPRADAPECSRIRTR